jgi:hypothetical protein
LFPLLDTPLVQVLTTSSTAGDVFRFRVEIFLAYAAVLEIVFFVDRFAILLKLSLKQAGGAADEIFVDGEFAVDAWDLEAYDSVSDTDLGQWFARGLMIS